MLQTAGVWIRSRPSYEPHVFVVGAPRSGTTLLRNLLITHSVLVGTDRESTGLIRVRNFSKFGLKEVSNEVWANLLAQSKGLPNLFDRLSSEIKQQKNGQCFVDKLSVAAWRLGYVRRFFPAARYICIIRDGRDSFCSARHHPNVQQSESVRSYARYWRRCVTLSEKMLASENTCFMRYEDLVSDPVQVMNRVMQFLELEFEEAQVSVGAYSNVSTLKNRSVHRNLAKPINTTSVGRWRSQLNNTEQRQFFRVAGNSLKAWRYAT